MEELVRLLERARPAFERISANPYLQAIRDGFLAVMPIILSSSVFLLVATLPGVFGLRLPQEVLGFFQKAYDYTMGVVGIMVAGTTASALVTRKNRELEAAPINPTSAMVTAMCGALLLMASEATGTVDGAQASMLSMGYLGTKGLLSAFVAAFVTVGVSAFCLRHHLVITMPREVPGAIAQSFRDIFAFSISVLICAGIDLACRAWLSEPFAAAIATLVAPLFDAADTYGGLALIWLMISLFWFVGIQGPSVVKPAINAALFGNIALNMQVLEAGGHPSIALTENFGNFVGELGGTGATLVVPFIFMFLMRSKQLRAVGRASFVPVLFAVNEPLLFGGPLILNPYFLVPFCVAPVCNVWIGKFFIDALGMNGFLYALPWALPGPVGIMLSTNLQPVALVLVIVLLVVDTVIYLPFCRAYDKVLCEQERERAQAGEDAAEVDEPRAQANGDAAQPATHLSQAGEDAPRRDARLARTSESLTNAGEPVGGASRGGSPLSPLGSALRVLVLCAGGGTSELLARAIREGAQAAGLSVSADAAAYGTHYAVLDHYDVVVLAPQVGFKYDEARADAERLGFALLAPRGAEYIHLADDPKAALAWVLRAADR